MSRRPRFAKLGILLVMAGIIGGFWISPLRDEVTLDTVRAWLDGVRSLWYGPVLFIGVYIVGCVMFLPASLFILAAALIWGWKIGGLYSVLGGAAGALLSFEVSRYVAHDLAWRVLAARGPKLMQVLGRAGFRTLLLMRFVPGIPFPVFNYGAGLTAIRTRDFFLSTLLGITPMTLVLAYSADALFSGALTSEGALARALLVCVLFGALIGVPMLLKRRVGGPLEVGERVPEGPVE